MFQRPGATLSFALHRQLLQTRRCAKHDFCRRGILSEAATPKPNPSLAYGCHRSLAALTRNVARHDSKTILAAGPRLHGGHPQLFPFANALPFSTLSPATMGNSGVRNGAASLSSIRIRIRTLQSRQGRSSPMASVVPTNTGSLAFFSNQNTPHPRPSPNNQPRGLGNIAGVMGTGALVLFGKTKYVLAALKLTKLAPLGSMVFTIGTYAMFFGLPYATGMVGLILVHEIGHAAVMHARGIPFSPMVFVPFMGAVIATKELPRDAWEDALVAFGGPVLGSLGAGTVALVGHATDSQLLIALGDFGLMINLFNLLPLGSMDGGRIAGAVSPYMSVAGVGMGAGLAYTGAIQNPIFYLILLSGGYQTFQRFYNPGSMPPNYYAITPVQRAAIGLGYVGLVGGLALAMDVNGRYKKSPEVLRREMELEKTWDTR